MLSGAAHPTITMHVASASIAFLMINRPFEFRTPYARLPRLFEYGEHAVARYVRDPSTMVFGSFRGRRRDTLRAWPRWPRRRLHQA
jgi:hypothetical protein